MREEPLVLIVSSGEAVTVTAAGGGTINEITNNQTTDHETRITLTLKSQILSVAHFSDGLT